MFFSLSSITKNISKMYFHFFFSATKISLFFHFFIFNILPFFYTHGFLYIKYDHFNNKDIIMFFKSLLTIKILIFEGVSSLLKWKTEKNKKLFHKFWTVKNSFFAIFYIFLYEKHNYQNAHIFTYLKWYKNIKN